MPYGETNSPPPTSQVRTEDFQAQLRADPRIQALRRANSTSGLDSAQLQALGYQVPDGYHLQWGGRAGYGTLMDNRRGFLEKAAPWISIGIAAVGAASAAGGVGGAGAPAGAARPGGGRGG